MDKLDRELYKVLDKVERNINADVAKRLRKVVNKLDKYQREGKITKKWADEVRIEVAKSLKKEIKDFQDGLLKASKTVYRKAYKTAYDGLDIGTWRGMPKKALEWFDKMFKPAMGIYSRAWGTSTVGMVQNIVMVGMINGTSVYDITQTLKKLIVERSRKRLQVVVRDQLGTAMQQGIWQTYQDHEDVIKGYIWAGPEDKRTTIYCHNRDMMTSEKPWTVAEVKRLIETNPLTYKGRKITAVGGNFLHPHIQCRHRLLAITRKE